jgi:hypothetical protein
MGWIESNFMLGDFLWHTGIVFFAVHLLRGSHFYEPCGTRYDSVYLRMRWRQITCNTVKCPISCTLSLWWWQGLPFILLKEGFKGFPFLCPSACDRVLSLAAIDPNIHCGRNNTCLDPPLSYRNIREFSRTCTFVQNSTHLLSNLNQKDAIIIIISDFL